MALIRAFGVECIQSYHNHFTMNDIDVVDVVVVAAVVVVVAVVVADI